MTESNFDFIVVGSGAGGGPLAARMALAGFRVLLLEAGGDEESISYSVPSYAPLAEENPYYRWDFYVRHYSNLDKQEKDTKYIPEREGVLYPRSSTLGGCTAHNAMITTYPSDSDWEYIANLTGDESWQPKRMRRYFEKLENCHYLDTTQALESGHGKNGWLNVEKADTSKAPIDWQLSETLETCKLRGELGPINEELDPNSIKAVSENKTGYFTIPQSTNNFTRNGPKEFVLQVKEQFPDRLVIATHSLATKILFDEAKDDKGNEIAIGVEYLKGSYLYKATPRDEPKCSLDQPELKRAFADKEVIISCGVYNTPQLLMLSGIGDTEHLKDFDIDTRVDLPGVGKNLQDRYEISLVNKMKEPFKVNEVATYSDNPEADVFLKMWLDERQGPYSSMGSPLMYLTRSFPDKVNPDIILFARSVRFQGFFPNWFWTFRPIHDQFTWTVLKAHTRNRGGEVLLKSGDPLDTPYINFHYFEEGTDIGGEDLRDISEGFKYARQLMDKAPFKLEEVLPGEQVQSDEQIQQYIRDQAWGHHASCTCPIGTASDPMAVLDSNFQVRGVRNLRVVDASVFPRIPGTFIVTPIYMISEKAAELIIDAYRCNNAD